MDSSSMITMDSSSSDGQRWCNGRWEGGMDVMGNGTAAAQWTAQWVTGDCQWMRGQLREQFLVFGWLVSLRHDCNEWQQRQWASKAA
jgi:hypothetical protein